MKNRWNDNAARAFIKSYAPYGADVALRTYSARLIGQESNLVLHGGGNTSVKTRVKTITGKIVDVLCVKGSGWDLSSIEPAGHPAVKLGALLSLRLLPALSDEAMMNFFRTHMLDASGPNPSVETLLHAFLPHKFIDHTHADAILALADQPDGIKRVHDWSGGRLGVVPYIMPGFALAKLAAQIYEKNSRVEGLVLYKHGIFTFGATAKESYDRMISWVSAAERLIQKTRPVSFSRVASPPRSPELTDGTIGQILRSRMLVEGKPAIVRLRATPALLKFANAREAAQLSQRGPATPDHVIRTKPKPLYLSPASLVGENKFNSTLARELKKFQIGYDRYFKTQSARKKVKKTQLDAFPRLAIVPHVGVYAIAADAKAAEVALDVYEHTVQIIENATRVNRYEVLSDSDLFDMEYWSLEQAKLGKSMEKPLSRKITWISGAASGIGLATARAFGEAGAHVFLTDVNQSALMEALSILNHNSRVAGMVCEVTSPAQVEKSFEQCARVFGGVDIVVSNAGIAPSSPMKSCDDALLRKSFEINFFAHQTVAQAAIRIFERQKLGGCLLFNVSKSAVSPGPDFGPYALPKTALLGLVRQYAIELGAIKVRSNAVNADRVNTNLFGEGLLEKRAKARGVSVEKYLSGNLLGREVLAADVARAFVSLALAEKTTGAIFPVDGGNIGAFPR